MKLSDLNPGDIFRYEDGCIEFLSGTFMRMDESNSYIRPITQKRCVFIIDMNTGVVHRHADHRKVTIISKSEDNMKSQKQMNHFIGWKFGVPVKVHLQCAEDAITGWLIQETENYFRILNSNSGITSFNKLRYYYELIPYKAGVVKGPRYPVCQSTVNAAYCNADEAGMTKLGVHYEHLKPIISIATLNIDDKTIELSAETTAELKKKLGV